MPRHLVIELISPPYTLFSTLYLRPFRDGFFLHSNSFSVSWFEIYAVMMDSECSVIGRKKSLAGSFL